MSAQGHAINAKEKDDFEGASELQTCDDSV